MMQGDLAPPRLPQPGVVLLDVQLPNTTGFEVARMLLTDPSPPVVVLVSSREAMDYGSLIERSGAAVFLKKSNLTALADSAYRAGVMTRRPALLAVLAGAGAAAFQALAPYLLWHGHVNLNWLVPVIAIGVSFAAAGVVGMVRRPEIPPHSADAPARLQGGL